MFEPGCVWTLITLLLCDTIPTFPLLPLTYALIRSFRPVFSHLWVLVRRAVSSGSLFSGERARQERWEEERANGEMVGQMFNLSRRRHSALVCSGLAWHMHSGPRQPDESLLIYISKRRVERNSVMSSHLPFLKRKTLFVELIESGMVSAGGALWGLRCISSEGELSPHAAVAFAAQV